MIRDMFYVMLIIWFFGTLMLGMYFLLQHHQYDVCEHLTHTKQKMCNRFDGVLSSEANGKTICLFTCTTPP